MTLRILAILSAAAISCAFAAGAQAQLASKGGPIAYSADNLEYQDGARQMVLTGNVDLVQNCARLQSNRLTLFFAPVAAGAQATNEGLSSGDVERIVAEGDVHYVRPLQKARGDSAVYDAKTDTVTFRGNVVITSAENVLRGETLVLQVGSGRSTLSPARKPGERVQGVYHPKQSTPPAPDPAAVAGC
ncbi:MAG: LptA/OstA family protein [Hyphomonadaceae bacterium]